MTCVIPAESRRVSPLSLRTSLALARGLSVVMLDNLNIGLEVRGGSVDDIRPLSDAAVGSWGGRRPSPGDYVTGTGATRGATAAGGC